MASLADRIPMNGEDNGARILDPNAVKLLKIPKVCTWLQFLHIYFK